MKIMVTGMPFAGHAGPLRPLVHGLVERGHEVRVHAGRRYAEAFRAAGATVVPWQAAADFDEHDLQATFPRLGPPTCSSGSSSLAVPCREPRLTPGRPLATV